MLRRHIRKLGVVLLLAFLVVGCDSFLSVEQDPNRPDRQRALSNPQDVETLIGGSFFQWWSNWQLFYPNLGLTNMANEFVSGSSTFAMQPLHSEPREPYLNSASARNFNHNSAPWNGMYGAISSVNDGIRAIKDARANNNQDFLDGLQANRALAFAKFVQGISHANIAILFDRGFIINENVDPSETTPELQPYTTVMDTAMSMMDEAMRITRNNDFQLPSDWIAGNPMNSSEFLRFMRSMKARKMVQVARTPQERADIDNGGIVDWDQVVDLAANGIEENFAIAGDGLGSDLWGMFNIKILGQSDAWGRVSYYTVGPAAENKGDFETWLAEQYPVTEKGGAFTIETQDRRIVGPDTLEGPERDWTVPGTDYYYLSGYNSNYAFRRYTSGEDDDDPSTFDIIGNDDVGSYTGDNLVGPLMFMLEAEIDLIEAEGLLRTGGSKARVAELINKTRVQRGDLPEATSANPRGTWEDRQDANNNGRADVSLWAMLKHEKNIECYGTATGIQYFDDRGWQDLIKGTPTMLPLPATELENLGLSLYTFGGESNAGQTGSAASGWGR
jgi:hypothetical protein